MAPANVG